LALRKQGWEGKETGSGALRLAPVDCCPACGSRVTRVKFTSEDLLHHVPGLFRYAECIACHTVFQDPRVRTDDLHLCYPEEYYTHFSDPALGTATVRSDGIRGALRAAVRKHADGYQHERLPAVVEAMGSLLSHVRTVRERARFGLLDSLVPAAGERRCLEVGPGRGEQLLQLSRLGWEAIGLDIDDVAAETSRRVSGCEVRVGSLETSGLPDGHFSMIYMHHTVEHVPDLVGTLRSCLRLLVPEGRVVLVYPNPRSLCVHRYGRFSYNWDPPRHLVLPPLEAMSSLLRRLGFSIVDARTRAGNVAAHAAFARAYRAGRGTEAAKADSRDRLLGLTEKLLVRLRLHLGEEIVVAARKAG
jgi:SAM-dependent methyltransferase